MLIEEAIVRVGRRGRGPAIVAALVLGAFLLGMVRPWDWLGGDRRPEAGPSRTDGSAAVPAGAAPGVAAPASTPVRQPTCGFPTAWRTAAIQNWAGLRARVWTAGEAVRATGPDDAAIPFNPVVSDVVEAIGWCAPVEGAERPPLAAAATLFRLRDGVALEIPFERLEPAGRDALGELWVPQEQTVGRETPWTAGRYVIRLATPTGSYARYLGLEIVLTGPGRSPSPEPGTSASPSPSPSPSTSPQVSGGVAPARYRTRRGP